MMSTVVLSLLLRLPLGVITKQGTSAHEIISVRGQSGTKNQVLNNWIIEYMLNCSCLEDLFPWKTLQSATFYKALFY